MNVRDFGARGDGLADDTSAVIAALASSNSPKLYFPPGQYLLGPVHLKSDVEMWGDQGAEIVSKDPGVAYADDSAHRLFYINDTESISNLVVHGLHFVRPTDNSAKYAFYLPTQKGPNKSITIQNCEFDKIGAIFCPFADGLTFDDNNIHDLWQDKTENAGNYTGSSGNAPYVLFSEGSTNLEIARNRASNIFAFTYINAGSSAGYGGDASDCIIRSNVVKDTADSCFMVRATAGAFDNLLVDGNIVTNCGKTPVKAEINNNSSEAFRNVTITNNQFEDWARYAGGEAIMVKGALDVPVTNKSLNAIVSNNAAIHMNYGGCLLQATDLNSIVLANNSVENTHEILNATYCDNVQVTGNHMDLATGQKAVLAYGLNKLILSDNTISGTVDGPVGGFFDSTQRFLVDSNVIENLQAGITDVAFAIQFANTGGDGSPQNSMMGTISNNYIHTPAFTFADGTGSANLKPFWISGARVASLDVHDNAIEDATNQVRFQGGVAGNVNNFLYYFDNQGVLTLNPTTGTLTVSGASSTATVQGSVRTLQGSPVGQLVPAFLGEEVLDTQNSTWYKSTGLASSDWVALN